MPEVAKFPSKCPRGKFSEARETRALGWAVPFGGGRRLAHLFQESLPSRSDSEHSPREKRRHLINVGNGETGLFPTLKTQS